ncbi:MAG: hypothetical protein BM557_02210 [Flavobacterium sp. MedPE-SWcel]|uniref:hypothetical protein n=1 Tax=uncultured Flavobacterium sp. TaxID=165435 RepID=UPI000921D9D9|nr:hypothetical protein [uncultured Flavobacterium sp.]OIQ22212.1 MAG: hypothetical protein BM557_02210 [Flavobacterium sp. MedPE-SWcel]
MDFFIVIFVIIVGGCWLVAKSLGSFLFGEDENKFTFHSTEIHNHYHEHKHINIIDEETKESIFELKDLDNRN